MGAWVGTLGSGRSSYDINGSGLEMLLLVTLDIKAYRDIHNMSFPTRTANVEAQRIWFCDA